MVQECTHLASLGDVTPGGDGCEECSAAGGRWVHLRMCMSCGHIGCCDDSPGRHATGHFVSTGHPVVQSYEPGEDWWWCFADELGFTVSDAPNYAHA
jgi:uncharacterized UBP type Zn finger protein